jgi:hypothetical protein
VYGFEVVGREGQAATSSGGADNTHSQAGRAFQVVEFDAAAGRHFLKWAAPHAPSEQWVQLAQLRFTWASPPAAAAPCHPSFKPAPEYQGEAAVHRRLHVYQPQFGCWLAGTVVGYSAATGTHTVQLQQEGSLLKAQVHLRHDPVRWQDQDPQEGSNGKLANGSAGPAAGAGEPVAAAHTAAAAAAEAGSVPAAEAAAGSQQEGQTPMQQLPGLHPAEAGAGCEVPCAEPAAPGDTAAAAAAAAGVAAAVAGQPVADSDSDRGAATTHSGRAANLPVLGKHARQPPCDSVARAGTPSSTPAAAAAPAEAQPTAAAAAAAAGGPSREGSHGEASAAKRARRGAAPKAPAGKAGSKATGQGDRCSLQGARVGVWWELDNIYYRVSLVKCTEEWLNGQ